MSILVLGIGNLIMSDDGVGIRAVQRLAEECGFPPGVDVVDGGTLGLDLLPILEGVDKLLLLDAVETGAPPGTVVRLSGDEIPAAMQTKLSPHQAGLQDLLLLAELQGNLPGEVVLLGVQPESIGIGMELSAPVASSLDRVMGMVLAELERWGISPITSKRSGGPADSAVEMTVGSDRA